MCRNQLKSINVTRLQLSEKEEGKEEKEEGAGEEGGGGGSRGHSSSGARQLCPISGPKLPLKVFLQVLWGDSAGGPGDTSRLLCA